MKICNKIKKGKGFIQGVIQKIRYRPLSYFKSIDKVYLASADQFRGMERIVESDSLLQCKHFYSVIGGLGGLNILAKLEKPSTIYFFDINPHMINICEFILEVINISKNRDEFISWIYARPFNSNIYNYETQKKFYDIPIDSNHLNRIEEEIGHQYREIYTTFYLPYIENPTVDIYDGISVHCTRMPIFHEAKANDVMTYPFLERKELERKGITSTNSFFFGKGWLKNEKRFNQVKENLRNAKVSVQTKSIFDISPKVSSGLYASNVLEGTERDFRRLTNTFAWSLWYSRRSNYLQLEYVEPKHRHIPFQKIYGENISDTHQSCCELIDEALNLGQQNFLEIIEPHITEEMNYGFRFYEGQTAISVDHFLKNSIKQQEKYNFLGIHILMGGGCPVEKWKSVVKKALSLNKTVFIFEHRKECSDWPEWDVNPNDILPEKEIDSFLLSLKSTWNKFGTANRKGNIADIRNICWITQGDERL